MKHLTAKQIETVRGDAATYRFYANSNFGDTDGPYWERRARVYEAIVAFIDAMIDSGTETAAKPSERVRK